MTAVLRRSLGATVVALLLAVIAIPGAHAAREVSMSRVAATGEGVTGVLTFRDAEVVRVDEGSLQATIDGEPYEVEIADSTSTQRSSILVIDTSGSMGIEGMATVRAATKAYLAEAPKDVRIGVATFGNTAGVDLAPTTDRRRVQRIVDGLVATGETSLYAGVRAAASELGNDGDRSMVLLSDGADTMSASPKEDLAKATKAVRDRGIRVDVVRFRTEDEDTMNALEGFAKAGQGSVLAADDAEAVGDAFQTAARALNSQAPFEIRTVEQLTGSRVVRLEGTANGTPFAVERTLTLAGPVASEPAEDEAEATPTAAPATAGSGVGMPAFSPWPWIGASALGLAVFLLAFSLLAPAVQSRREQRVAAIDRYVPQAMQLSRRDGKRDRAPITEQLVNFGERRMAKRGSTARTMQLINRADLPFRAGEWFVLCAVAIVIGIALGVALVPGPWIVGLLLGAVLGAVLPQVVLRVLAGRRARAFERVLPDALILVATSLKSGFGLMQSLDGVAQDAAAPVNKEFSRAIAETRIGTDIADALEHMAQRMGSEAMEMAVMAIRIQREVGGNLAETLERTAHTLREREVLHRQVQALSAEGRLSAQILIALPLGLLAYMLLVNFEYISLLWSHPLGLLMSVGAIVGLIIGIIWMRRVVRIEV